MKNSEGDVRRMGDTFRGSGLQTWIGGGKVLELSTELVVG